MDSKKFEYILFVYQKNDQFKNLIYTRGSIIVAMYVFIIPGLISIMEKYPEVENCLQAIDIIFFVIIGFSILFSSLSIFFGVQSMQPFDWVSKIKKITNIFNTSKKNEENEDVDTIPSEEPCPPLTAFPYVIQLSCNDFEKKILSFSDDDIYKDLLKGLYNLCHINNSRYKSLKKSYQHLFLTLLCFMIVVLVWLIKINII